MTTINSDYISSSSMSTTPKCYRGTDDNPISILSRSSKTSDFKAPSSLLTSNGTSKEEATAIKSLPSMSTLTPLRIKATPNILSLSFKSYVRSLLKAALHDERSELNSLLDLPLFGDKIPTVCKRLPSAQLLEYLIKTCTEDFSQKEFLEIIQKINKSLYIASLSEKKLLNIYAILFNSPQTDFLPRPIPFALTQKAPERVLPYIFIEILKHPSFQGASLTQVLSVVRQFNTQSDLLQSIFFTVLFKHPAIRSLPKDILLHHFNQTPPAYKTSFLTQMIQQDSFKKTSFEELVEFIRKFRTFARNEYLTTSFYEAVFNHPAIKCISNLETLKCIYPEESNNEAIPLLSQVVKHPLGSDASLATIKVLIKSFNALYKVFPCSDHLAEDFYSAIFKMPSISLATEEELVQFLKKAPHFLLTLATSFALKHPSFQIISKENLLKIFEYFLIVDTRYPSSRHVNLKFIQAAVSHSAMSLISSQEVLAKIIAPAKGYKLIDLILTALSSWEVQAFSLDELYFLNRLFLDEIEALEGPKSPSRMAFYTAVCEHLQEKGSLSTRAARAETHKLVHSYKSTACRSR